MARILYSIFTIFILGVCAACQSAPWKNLEHVQKGQTKAVVLEAMGSPSTIRRTHGHDVWLYDYDYHPDGKFVREIDFADGRVVYIGAPRTPKVSAEEQDQLNSLSTQRDSEARSSEEAKRERRLGASRPASGAQEDHIDHKFRESLYGVESDPDIEKRKQAPVFEPVE